MFPLFGIPFDKILPKTAHSALGLAHNFGQNFPVCVAIVGTISGLRAGPLARLASETRLRAQCPPMATGFKPLTKNEEFL